jgi:uncharacterized protein YbaP (TraB family)
MSSQKITVALNELRTSVSQQVRSIKKDVHQLDTYKTNYDALLELPLVKHLIKENKKLKKQNSKQTTPITLHSEKDVNILKERNYIKSSEPQETNEFLEELDEILETVERVDTMATDTIAVATAAILLVKLKQ